jgi:transcriptional regulator with XRE-family HTH domain
MRNAPPRQKFASHLGAAAREARSRLGLTQVEVADRVGIALEVYGRIERGALLPSIQTFWGLCHVLEADPRVLLGLLDADRTPGDPPHVRRLTHLARELGEAEVVALQGVARAMVALRKEGRRKP